MFKNWELVVTGLVLMNSYLLSPHFNKIKFGPVIKMKAAKMMIL